MSETVSLADLIVEKGKAGYAAVYLHSLEDQRSLREIRQAADELKRKMFFWTPGVGLLEDSRRQTTVIQDTEMPEGMLQHCKNIKEEAVIVLRLFHHFLRVPDVQGHILNLIPEFKMSRRMFVLLTPVLSLPQELEKEFSLLEAPLPTEEQLEVVLNGIFDANQFKEELRPTPERKKELIEAAKGLTTQEAENAFTLSYTRPRKKGAKAKDALWRPEIVLDEKCLSLRATGLLEYTPVPAGGLDLIGGLDNLKEWIRPLGKAFTKEALEFGCRQPKGVLFVGPPGCGKSLTAKAISSALMKPLLKLDMGRIYGSLVGQSEGNIRMAIRIAEAIAPCILWLDEIEKGISGAGAGALDSGVSARVLGTLLTWMQEKTTPVFVVATANNVHMLPPETLRKGRFDELFSVDLPSQRERKEILRIHLRMRRRENLILPEKEIQKVGGPKIDLDHFAGETTQDFTGAEIEGAIDHAMRVAFFNDRELSPMDLQEAFDSTQPIAKTMQEQLTMVRNWCKARTRPANRAEAPIRAGVAGRAIDA